jgi:hypothetical protein
MWAHIGDHVSEYVVYVDNIETTIVSSVCFSVTKLLLFPFDYFLDF